MSNKNDLFNLGNRLLKLKKTVDIKFSVSEYGSSNFIDVFNEIIGSMNDLRILVLNYENINTEKEIFEIKVECTQDEYAELRCKMREMELEFSTQNLNS